MRILGFVDNDDDCAVERYDNDNEYDSSPHDNDVTTMVMTIKIRTTLLVMIKTTTKRWCFAHVAEAKLERMLLLSRQYRQQGSSFSSFLVPQESEWDRVGRCYSEESESVQVSGTGWAVLQRGVRVCPGEWDRVGRCYREKSESVQTPEYMILDNFNSTLGRLYLWYSLPWV
jgi:hypothetical protein